MFRKPATTREIAPKNCTVLIAEANMCGNIINKMGMGCKEIGEKKHILFPGNWQRFEVRFLEVCKIHGESPAGRLTRSMAWGHVRAH